MKRKYAKVGCVAQNMILGTITSSMVAYNLRVVFSRLGGIDLVWILFFFMGPAVGYLSGKERQRIELLKLEKQRLKEDLGKIEAALKKSTQKYRLLVEHANDAIYLTTLSGKILLFNEATSLLSGYSKDRLKQMNVADLKHARNLPDRPPGPLDPIGWCPGRPGPEDRPGEAHKFGWPRQTPPSCRVR